MIVIKKRQIFIYVGCSLLLIFTLKSIASSFNEPTTNKVLTDEETNVIVDKPLKVEKIGTKAMKDSCNVMINLNPFEEEITKAMIDFNQHVCQSQNELTLQFKDENKLLVSAYKLNFVSGSNILKKDASYEIADKKLLSKPLHDPAFIKGLLPNIYNINYCPLSDNNKHKSIYCKSNILMCLREMVENVTIIFKCSLYYNCKFHWPK